MVQRDVASPVHKNQRRCRAGTVQIEVFLANRYRNTLQCWIEVLPDAFDVSQLIFWLRIFSLSAITVELRRSQQGQAARTEFGSQLSDHRPFGFAVTAPVCPE